MAHFIRVLKANHLKSKWVDLVKEKDIGLVRGEEESEDESSEDSVEFKSKYRKPRMRMFATPNTFENVVLESFLGFVGGVLLTYIFFFFFNVGVNFSLKTTTYICAFLGIFLCLGLAYSSQIRCCILLLLPMFFSKQGRQALLAYALFLAFTGPARNTMHNMGILSDSMTCGQEMVRKTLRQIFDMVKAPFRSIKETLKKLTETIKQVVDGVKAFINQIKRIVVSILNVIKKTVSWLRSIVSFCQKKIGTPFQRCMKTFDDAIIDCKAKLGVMDFLCHVVHLVKALCYTVKWLDFICLFTEFVSDKMIGVVKKKLREFSLHMRNLFYVSVEFSHSYEFETKASNSTKQVTRTILRKISKKMEKVQTLFSFFGFIFGFVFLFMFVKVYYYKYKFLTSDRYDNHYINKYIIELDLKRARKNRETVLPLEPREKKKYAKASAIRLLTAEKKRIAESMFLLSLATLKVITFILVDYGLFWVLITIYETGQGSVDDVEYSKLAVHIDGKGILANFYKRLGNTFNIPRNPYMHLNPLHCLPDPVQPDTGRYIQIGFLVVLCWFLTVTEAYGLRLRNTVMSHYYPDRAKERAVWLYNHILRSRGTFVRFVRRQLRRQYGVANQSIEKVSVAQKLFTSFPLLRAIFGRNKDKNCLICWVPECQPIPLKRCKTSGCPGRFCFKCYASIENVCTICQSPIEYGDMSDISEEWDSSEEDVYKRCINQKKSNFSEKETNKSFKDLQTRDSFKDLEANKKPDYVRLGDLYNNKKALKKRIREALFKRLQNIEAAKHQVSKQKEAKYQQIKSKIQEIIQKLKRTKGQQLNQPKPKEEMALLPKKKVDYERLKNEIREKIYALKKKKEEKHNFVRKPVRFESETSSEESSSDTKPKNTFTYYFVEKETDFFKPAQPKFDDYSELRSMESRLYVRHRSFKNSRHHDFII